METAGGICLLGWAPKSFTFHLILVTADYCFLFHFAPQWHHYCCNSMQGCLSLSTTEHSHADLLQSMEHLSMAPEESEAAVWNYSTKFDYHKALLRRERTTKGWKHPRDPKEFIRRFFSNTVSPSDHPRADVPCFHCTDSSAGSAHRDTKGNISQMILPLKVVHLDLLDNTMGWMRA